MTLQTLVTVILLVLLAPHSAAAWQMIHRDRIYFYFPQGQQEKASRLLSDCEPIIAFLENIGLPPQKPLHILLDENLDEPKVRVAKIPHHQIRIPLRAPGVLEDGSEQADPWHYFLFMGLAAHGIFAERSGLPGKLHALLGEIISPNLILPEWGIDGISFLLYEKYRGKQLISPLADIFLATGPIPDLDIVSNHPDVWPGRFSYRIYGRPFVRWLDQRYGWEKLLQIIKLHGRGIIPVEIDSEAQSVFGKSWYQLWQEFREIHAAAQPEREVQAALPPEDFQWPTKGRLREEAAERLKRFGWPIVGYWHEPFTYWNDAGVHPGLQKEGWRGRYGYVDNGNWLLVSEYDPEGISKLKSVRRDQFRTAPQDHIWDPGPGGVAVSRKGSRPYLVFHQPVNSHFLLDRFWNDPIREWVAGPPGVIQLSGPVMDDRGRVAVAGNLEGNWDIWLFDGQWHRMTSAPSIEMDPWFLNGHLVFASNLSGRFQIHAQDMRQLTHSFAAALMPRGQTFLELAPAGWFPNLLPLEAMNTGPFKLSSLESGDAPADDAQETAAYSPWHSLMPNYIVPDLFTNLESLQVGLATEGVDVTGDFAVDGGIRYDFNDEMVSWRVGGKARDWIARATRYPFGYGTARHLAVDEVRYDLKLGWLPFHTPVAELSINRRYFSSYVQEIPGGEETWLALHVLRTIGNWRTRATLDLFDKGSQSLYGEAVYLFGQRIKALLQIEAGKTWGDPVPGHNSFRIGGNTAEGYFTQRPSRLFPLRGFDENILDASQAVTAGVEALYPLFYLQSGYKTLPLFLRNISLGAFVDSGIAGEHFGRDDLLVGAGVELVTGMELAWGFKADFRVSLAWPVLQPDDLNQKGPKFLMQLGRPL